MPAGGVGAGLALAFLIEMLLDRSLKRPVEIETKLGLPLFISIPDFNRNGHLLAKTRQAKTPLLLTETAGKGESENTGPGRLGAGSIHCGGFAMGCGTG